MKKKYAVGSLFAGVGGICLGFKFSTHEKAEYDIVWANEIDAHASETYRTNFDHPLLEGDIKKVLHPELVDKDIEDAKNAYENAPDEEKEEKFKILTELQDNRDFDIAKYSELHEQILSKPIDILNGGFPCQAFSIAGEQKGFEDERGNLFLSIVELINQLAEKFQKPRVLFLENVKNLQAHDSGNTYKVIKGKLEECGYTIFERVLNTMTFTDLPQNRERIYIIGFLNKQDADKFKLFEDDVIKIYKNSKTSADRANDVKKLIDYNVVDKKYFYTREKYPHYFVSESEFHPKSDKDIRINLEEGITEMQQFYQLRRGQYIRKNQSDVCPTLTANMGTGGHNVPLILTDKGIRKLTPEEAFRLQGFPVESGYKFPEKFKGRTYPDSALYKQAGNAVSVPVIKLIAEYILNILVENDNL